MGPFTVFDVETTGMSPVRDRIVEIGAVRVDRDGVRTHFETLVNPGMPIPYQAPTGSLILRAAQNSLRTTRGLI